jgi:hypothetical protein
MHASIACLLLYEDYVWVSLENAMKAKQSVGTHPRSLETTAPTTPPSAPQTSA